MWFIGGFSARFMRISSYWSEAIHQTIRFIPVHLIELSVKLGIDNKLLIGLHDYLCKIEARPSVKG